MTTRRTANPVCWDCRIAALSSVCPQCGGPLERIRGKIPKKRNVKAWLALRNRRRHARLPITTGMLWSWGEIWAMQQAIRYRGTPQGKTALRALRRIQDYNPLEYRS